MTAQIHHIFSTKRTRKYLHVFQDISVCISGSILVLLRRWVRHELCCDPFPHIKIFFTSKFYPFLHARKTLPTEGWVYQTHAYANRIQHKHTANRWRHSHTDAFDGFWHHLSGCHLKWDDKREIRRRGRGRRTTVIGWWGNKTREQGRAQRGTRTKISSKEHKDRRKTLKTCWPQSSCWNCFSWVHHHWLNERLPSSQGIRSL